MRLRHIVSGMVLALLPTMPASAHAGFLWPVIDRAEKDGTVRMMASFSDDFPHADIALKSDHWTIVDPEGTKRPFETIASSNSRTFVETALTTSGTYRLSSGERLGRTGQAALIDGTYRLLGRDGLSVETLPEGTSILTSQTATVSDFYITRGEISDAVLDTRIGRLHIAPLQNPTNLVTGEPFEVQIVFEDQAITDQRVTWFTPSGSREEADPETQLQTDPNGRISVTPLTAGAHLLMVRRIAPAPEGADTDVRSYTTVLSFEVK
jgi:uncharacterized GH25 family protein